VRPISVVGAMGRQSARLQQHCTSIAHVSRSRGSSRCSWSSARYRRLPQPVVGTGFLAVAALCGYLGRQNLLCAAHPATRVGRVRFVTQEDASSAVAKLDGKEWRGQCLTLQTDMSDGLGNMILVNGLNGLTRWQELKGYLATVAEVAWLEITASDSFAEVRFNNSSGAEQAVETLQGAKLCGSELLLELATGDESGRRVLLHGISPATRYKDVEKLLRKAGQVDFVFIHRASAEVRFETAESAQRAVNELDGSELRGRTIKVALHHKSPDGTKVIVTGLGMSTNWQDLKDYFGKVGRVAFVGIGEKGSYNNPW